MQVAISISEGRLSSATLMRRLRSNSRKNRIYKCRLRGAGLDTLGVVTLQRLGRGFVAIAMAAALTGGVAGCSAHGAHANCSPTQCTVTFDRGISSASISVLGVQAKLVAVNNGSVTLSVAGNQVTVPVNQSAQAGGLQVTLKSVTASKVVVQISAN